MNLLNSFNYFYDNLSSDGLFFFWIVFFLFAFLVVLCTILVIKNKKLIKLLNEEKNNSVENKKIILEDEKLEDKQEEVIDNNLDNIKIDFEDNKENEVHTEEKVNTEDNIKTKISEEPKLYEKNVLREMSQKMPTSPINIEKSKISDEYDVVTLSNSLDDTDYSILDLKEDSLSPLVDMEDAYEINDNMKFASEIVEKMEKEMKPSNIELTDYEKKQEEEAIISYDELLKVKDKIYNITDDEETDEFIDELKNLRLDLQ